jgi:hypothetical protein
MDQKVIEAGMFNELTSASDHTYLLNLLREVAMRFSDSFFFFLFSFFCVDSYLNETL